MRGGVAETVVVSPARRGTQTATLSRRPCSGSAQPTSRGSIGTSVQESRKFRGPRALTKCIDNRGLIEE
jgi:hypothetical protein